MGQSSSRAQRDAEPTRHPEGTESHEERPVASTSRIAKRASAIFGQSSSKSRRRASSYVPAATGLGGLEEHHADDSSPASASARPSLRKRVASLIKPSGKETGERRKSWRNSRRFSKSPMDFTPAEPTVAEGDVEQPPSPSPEASTSRLPSTQSIPQSDKGKSREEEDVDSNLEQDAPHPETERPSTPYPALPEQPVSSSSTRDQSDAQNAVGEPTATPAEAPEPDPGLRQAPTSPQPPPPPPSRHFPPPGTLVVVQGIVHTTDVSRPQPPSVPEGDHSSSRARDSLDMLRRPRSSSLSGPHPPESDPANDLHPPPPPPAETLSRSNNTISPGSIDVLGTLLSVAAAATAASLLTGSSEPILTSGLAPHGTGSEQQQQQPQPQPQQQSQPHDDQGTYDSIYSRRPRPVATEYPPSPDNYATTRAERMRQAWSTIRERLGLRPNPPASQPSLGSNGSTPPGDPSHPPVTDTRELMLAEMARAFNIGLGLNGLGSSPSSSSPTSDEQHRQDEAGEGAGTERAAGGEASSAGAAPSSSPPSRTLPPEGSFDRFLVDLQADLRVALTRDNDRDQQEGSVGQGQDGPVEEDARASPIAPQDSSNDLPPPLEPIDVTESQETMLESPPPREDLRSDDATTFIERLPSPMSSVNDTPTVPDEEEEEEEVQVDQTRDDMPSLASLSDSDSELDDDDEDEDDEDHDVNPNALEELLESRAIPIHSPHPPTPIPASSLLPPNGTPETLGARASASTPSNGNTGSTEANAATGNGNGNGNAGIGAGRMDASGRINWWRLYRFPAITSSPRNSTSGPPPSATNPPPSNTSSNGPGPSPAPTSSGTGATATPAPFLPTFLPPPIGQTVVPVIVVGLQSVAANLNLAGPPPVTPPWASAVGGGATSPLPPHNHHHHHHHHHHHPEEHDDLAGLGSGLDGASLDGDDIDHDIFGLGERSSEAGLEHASQSDTEHDDGTGRAEAALRGGWQSRAANALRNLRPGAAGASGGGAAASTGTPATPTESGRGGDSGAARGGARPTTTRPGQMHNHNHNHNHNGSVPFNPQGSRTFLIYVIGGYYPPDHNIVTGGPESFESFEALLELAEMLGNVKPPTVTKEDIDKSGLETIKPAMLASYEEQGRVASSCTERCLICLDDYEPEDDVRLMSCRHAFHQGCVDKWLQTGRNNCPACRSTGVPVESSSPVNSAA